MHDTPHSSQRIQAFSVYTSELMFCIYPKYIVTWTIYRFELIDGDSSADVITTMVSNAESDILLLASVAQGSMEVCVLFRLYCKYVHSQGQIF